MLADGINLGLTRMSETCRGASLRQLALVHDWHVSEAAYTEALARLIDAHRALPLAQVWGDGTRASSGFFRTFGAAGICPRLPGRCLTRSSGRAVSGGDSSRVRTFAA